MFKDREMHASPLAKAPVTGHFENYDIDVGKNTAIQRKLQSKVEALNIVKRQMEQYRMERDQFKLMAETLQLRYSAIKKSLNDAQSMDYGIQLGQASSVASMVSETREKNIALNTEVEALRQRVDELEGDADMLRKKLSNKVKQERSNSGSEASENGDLSMKEKFELIAQLEALKKKNTQIKYDFRMLIDEKEDIIMERDAYKCKVHRLNHELNNALRGNNSQTKVLDIDSLILENALLQERVKNVENELELCQQSCAKYKTMLDTKRKRGIIKLGSNQSDMIMSHKQVKNLLENGTGSELPTKAETISDLKSLCLALLDSLNDKTLALSHQKKANKILATQASQLEQKMLSLCGECLPEGTEKPTTLSSASILLNGYSAANVDQETRRSSIEKDVAALRRHIDDIDRNVETAERTQPNGHSPTLEPMTGGTNISETVDCETRSEVSDFDSINKIDIEDLPDDVVSILREALNGIACNDGADDVNTVGVTDAEETIKTPELISTIANS